MNDKRLEQLKETWIKNVIKVQNITRDEAEKQYDKIQPHKVEVSTNKHGRVEIREGGQIIGEQG